VERIRLLVEVIVSQPARISDSTDSITTGLGEDSRVDDRSFLAARSRSGSLPAAAFPAALRSDVRHADG
jgi:hypothetical protein